MLRKTIKFTDYNGVEREETHYFHLSKAEIMEMELSTTGGFTEMIDKVIAAKDMPSIIRIFKDLILKSYGEKSPDGRQFIKIDENGRPLYNKFVQTEAYSVLFMELATNAEAAADFVNGIVPSDISKDELENNTN